MIHARVKIVLDAPTRSFNPGDLLAGQFVLEGIAPEDLRSVELSVLWHTEGKGEEDMSVHFFERLDPQNGQEFNPLLPHLFSTTLPNSPLSYAGFIVKICWCVRVRVFLARGKELSVEVPFQLGKVPQPEQAAS
jgi:hypothetical protein